MDLGWVARPANRRMGDRRRRPVPAQARQATQGRPAERGKRQKAQERKATEQQHQRSGKPPTKQSAGISMALFWMHPGLMTSSHATLMTDFRFTWASRGQQHLIILEATGDELREDWMEEPERRMS
jgi:hypothetical protein